MGRSSHFLILSSLLTASALWLGCGGSQPPAAGPAEPGAEPAADAPGAEGSSDVWSDTMSQKQKADFMKKKVVPAMSKTFQEFDAKKYADFGCKTCHGPSMKPHPVDFLPELTIKDGKLTVADSKADMVKFMGEKVAPQMAEIFGKPHYDPATGKGFGCGGCHKMNM